MADEDGFALKVESLEPTLRNITFDARHLSMHKANGNRLDVTQHNGVVELPAASPFFEDLPYEERRRILAKTRNRGHRFHAAQAFASCDCCGLPTRTRFFEYANSLDQLTALQAALSGVKPTTEPVMVEVARHMLCDVSVW